MSGDAFDPDAFFERFDQDQLGRLGAEVDLERFEELTRHAVAARPQRDLLVELMRFPHRFFVEPKGDEFELRLVALESGNSVTLDRLPLADVVRKPQAEPSRRCSAT